MIELSQTSERTLPQTYESTHVKATRVVFLSLIYCNFDDQFEPEFAQVCDYVFIVLGAHVQVRLQVSEKEKKVSEVSIVLAQDYGA